MTRPICEVHGTEMEYDDGAPFCLECDENPAPDVWIVGRDMGEGAWQFMGAFTDEDGAKAACSRADDFVGPAVLDRKTPEAEESWPNAYYPLAASPEVSR